MHAYKHGCMISGYIQENSPDMDFLMIISFLSQKGGVTKSTLARAVATAFLSEKWSVHIVDFDWQQQTCAKWSERREERKELTQVEVSVHRRIDSALKLSNAYDVLIVDGRPASDKDSIVIANKSDLVVLPTGTAVDDLQPQLTLANELKQNGIKNIYFVVNKSATAAESINAVNTIKEWGYEVSDHAIPFKAGYSSANDFGLSIIETRYKSLTEIAEKTISDVLQKAVSTGNTNNG